MLKKLTNNQPAILIVDDEVTTRATLKARLEKVEGYTVFEAENGKTAIKMAKDKRPDIIILDWKMPDLSGIDVLHAIRDDNRTKHIPVFMLTSKNLVSDVEIAFEMGALEYFSKPLDLNLISGKVHRYTQSLQNAG